MKGIGLQYLRLGLASPEGVNELASDVSGSEQVVVVQHVGGTPALGAPPLLPAPPNVEVCDKVTLCCRKPGDMSNGFDKDPGYV